MQARQPTEPTNQPTEQTTARVNQPTCFPLIIINAIRNMQMRETNGDGMRNVFIYAGCLGHFVLCVNLLNRTEINTKSISDNRHFNVAQPTPIAHSTLCVSCVQKPMKHSFITLNKCQLIFYKYIYKNWNKETEKKTWEFPRCFQS